MKIINQHSKSKKYYFYENNDERAENLGTIIDTMSDNGIKEKVVFEAITDKCKDYFYCSYHNEGGESGMCGKSCDEYKPRNGKNGICKYRMFCAEKGEQVLIKII